MDELHRLRKLPANKACANCGVVSATGHGAAVMTFGIFVCHGCKSAHQSFSHLCKSVSMSYWSLAEVAKLRDGGNERARASWMARCSSAARLRFYRGFHYIRARSESASPLLCLSVGGHVFLRADA